MTTSTHSVTPEEVMALVDGELPEAEARAVAAHLDECAECAGVAAQFRRLSEQMAEWDVGVVPAWVETVVMERAGEAGRGRGIGRRTPIRGGGVRWGRWAVGLGGALAAVFVVVLVVSPQSHERTVMYQSATQPPAEEFARPQPSGIAGMAADAPTSAATYPYTTSAADKNAAAAGMRMRSEMEAAKGQLHAQQSMLSENMEVAKGAAPAGPMIARTASLTLRVKDAEGARPALEAILARHHGFMAQMNVSSAVGAPHAFTASLRVPAAELAAALADLRGVGRVENESQSGEEVTQQHQDLVARLKTSRETEARFQAILQKQTGSVTEVLEVEQEIARVRGEIESMEAEQAGLEHRVVFASVEVSLVEEYKAEFNGAADSVSTRMHNALVAGWRNASETVLGIVLFVEEYAPALMVWGFVLGVPVVLVWRRWRKAGRQW